MISALSASDICGRLCILLCRCSLWDLIMHVSPLRLQSCVRPAQTTLDEEPFLALAQETA